jgi:hypothetical protein
MRAVVVKTAANVTPNHRTTFFKCVLRCMFVTWK